jgi:hypothetical protein
MKTIFALVTALSLGSAYAQQGGSLEGGGYRSSGGLVDIRDRQAQTEEGQRHMIEFTAESVPTLIYALERTKTKGTEGDNESGSSLSFNYAYTIHPNVQVGGKFSFFNGVFANNDVERMDVQVGAWFNTKAGDLFNSPYIAALVGTGYAQTFGERGGRDDLWLGSLALGKRFSMERWGVKHLTWTPEIAFVYENSTNDSNFDYRQATEFRVLQFSVLW